MAMLESLSAFPLQSGISERPLSGATGSGFGATDSSSATSIRVGKTSTSATGWDIRLAGYLTGL